MESLEYRTFFWQLLKGNFLSNITFSCLKLKFLFNRDYRIKEEQVKDDPIKITAASMEGKLKEKLESMGIAFLCLGIAKINIEQLNNVCKLLTQDYSTNQN